MFFKKFKSSGNNVVAEVAAVNKFFIFSCLWCYFEAFQIITENISITTSGLCLIKGPVCIFKKLIVSKNCNIFRQITDTYAAGDGNAFLRKLDFSYHMDKVHGFFDQVLMTDVFQKNYKFIPACTYQNIFGTEKTLKKFCELCKDLISKKMSVIVVDIFEIVNIKKHHSTG